MKTVLACFSGTGNSLAVARMLAGALPDASVLLVRELLRDPSRLDGCDACGFVFPVYCQDAPEIVQRLVRLAPLPGSAYLFGVATHNGDPGFSHFTLDAILRGKGRRLSAGFAVLMPGNSITPGCSLNPEDEVARRIEASAAAVARIAGSVSERQVAPFEGDGSLRKRFKGFRNRLRHRNVASAFRATDACTGCGLCARLCPEGNIRMESGKPTWGNRCQICLACIHWCPVRAIQNGEGTEGRPRYHHPGITAADLIPGRPGPG